MKLLLELFRAIAKHCWENEADEQAAAGPRKNLSRNFAGRAPSLDEAIALFDELADMEDLAFGYAENGCYARTHLMGLRMTEAGLEPQKVWAFEPEFYKVKSLTVQNCDGTKTSWWYHVAPILAVEMPDGTVENLIFDPSLFDGPATMREWAGVMDAEISQVEMTSWTQKPSQGNGNYTPGRDIDEFTDDRSQALLAEYLPLQKEGKRVVFASHARQETALHRVFGTEDENAALTGAFRQAKEPVGFEGRSWISYTLVKQAEEKNRAPSLSRTEDALAV